METLKNIQTIFLVLSEHKIQIATILFLISLLNIIFNIVVLNNCKKNIANKNKEKK